MRQNLLAAFLLVAAVAVAGCTTTQEGAVTSPENQTSQRSPEEAASSATIQMSDAGFSPQEVTIRQGGTVTWTNSGSIAVWPASAIHPTHEVYPDSSITKCGTTAQEGIFDACDGIQPGDEWSFTFSEKGTWAYHDHMNPSRFGRVNVV